jgi:hypothetical protein
MIYAMPVGQRRCLSSGQREVVQAGDAEHGEVGAVAFQPAVAEVFQVFSLETTLGGAYGPLLCFGEVCQAAQVAGSRRSASSAVGQFPAGALRVVNGAAPGVAGSALGAGAVRARVQAPGVHRWLKTPVGGDPHGLATSYCDADFWLQDAKTGGLKKAGTTEVDGQQAITLTREQAGVTDRWHVATEGQPYIPMLSAGVLIRLPA